MTLVQIIPILNHYASEKTKGSDLMKKMTIHNLYLNLIQELHSCECQTIVALPNLAEASSDKLLQKMFNKHLLESQEHLWRLDHILSTMHKGGGHKVCKVTWGLLKEGEELIKSEADGKVRDAGLLCVAIRLEHNQIAMYGCLRAYAALIHRATDVRLLDLTLGEEKEAERSLSDIVIGKVNERVRQPATMATEGSFAEAM